MRGSGPSSLPAPGQTTGGSAGLGRKQPLKHAFSVGQAPRQPPGDCRFTFLPKGCPSNAAFTLASALRRAGGPQGGSPYIQVWLRGLPAEFGETRQVPRARGGSLKNLFPRERGLSVCAPGNPRAVLSGFLPGRKTKQNEPRPHVRLPYLEKGPVFRARAGRRAMGSKSGAIEVNAARRTPRPAPATRKDFGPRDVSLLVPMSAGTPASCKGVQEACVNSPDPSPALYPVRGRVAPDTARRQGRRGPRAPCAQLAGLSGPSGAGLFLALSLKALGGERRSVWFNVRCQRPPS